MTQPRWTYGNPKSITGILHYTDATSRKTDVGCGDDNGQKQEANTSLSMLLSDLLEIYNAEQLRVKITVEVLDPPHPEPKYFLNDETAMDLLEKDLTNTEKTGHFIPLDSC
ncbi:MAG: hypothetical protein ABFC24_11520 [Methanoregulaceae archaeon]